MKWYISEKFLIGHELKHKTLKSQSAGILIKPDVSRLTS